MRTSILLCAAIGVLSLHCLTAHAEREESNLQTSGASTLTADEAVKLALEYTGFDRADYRVPAKASDVADLVVLADDKTPFFSDRINGRELWRVTFEDVYLDLPGWMPVLIANQTRKTYDVYLDPQTSQLLKIESRYDGSDPDLVDEPPAEEAEKALEYWKHDRLPVSPPSVDLYQALAAAVPSYPLHAKQLIATLVIYDYMGKGAGPIWFIFGRGTPPAEPMTSKGAGIPVYQRNRVRTLVDGESGVLLGSEVNSPPAPVRE